MIAGLLNIKQSTLFPLATQVGYTSTPSLIHVLTVFFRVPIKLNI